MVEFLFGVAVTITIVNLLFFFIGYYAGRGSLQDKVRQIIRRPRPEEQGGIVKPMTPEELTKKRTREVLDKFT